MLQSKKHWRICPVKKDLSDQLSEKLGISAMLAQLLINRGIIHEEDAKNFLSLNLQLEDPWKMADMSAAVSRILCAIEKAEKIIVYGDYDVDGITACSLMYKFLANAGALVDYYIPERQNEGYGLNAAALTNLAEQGAELIITVDCGISSYHEIAAIRDRLDIIVTDHHQPSDRLPEAVAVINPKRTDCPYPDKQLAGVGVAFKLLQALAQRLYSTQEPPKEYLALVAVGTIADIVPLTGENRTLVRLGLAELEKRKNLGLNSLIRVSGLENSKIDTGNIAFSIAPRLNASGRVGHAASAVELLITQDAAKAALIAERLDKENTLRQALEKEITAAAEAVIAKCNMKNDKVIVVDGEGWHSGVIGIVASRLVERYYRPVIVIGTKDGIGKGSCRSIPGFNIFEALSANSNLLVKYGGHKQAAGLTIETQNISLLRERLSLYAAACLSEESYRPVIQIDSVLPLESINNELLEQLNQLAPHGMGNPAPVFACENVSVANVRPVGQSGKHLKLRIKKSTNFKDVIAWGMGELAASLEPNELVDLAFVPEVNEWQGRRSIQLKAFDVRKTVS